MAYSGKKVTKGGRGKKAIRQGKREKEDTGLFLLLLWVPRTQFHWKSSGITESVSKKCASTRWKARTLTYSSLQKLDLRGTNYSESPGCLFCARQTLVERKPSN